MDRQKVNRKRFKSYYFDRYTGKIEQASKMPSPPFYRPRRYLFVKNGYVRPCDSTIENILKFAGIATGRNSLYFYRNKTNKKLPF